MTYAMTADEVSLVSGSPFFMRAAAAAIEGDTDRLNMIGAAQKEGVNLASNLNYLTSISQVYAQTVADARPVEERNTGTYLA